MAIEKVRSYLKQFGLDERIREHSQSSATVELAAAAVGVEGARIAKTLSFKTKEGSPFLLITAGDTKIDNKKFREEFHCKAKMLSPEEVLEFVGHEVGGVCPFAVSSSLPVYTDVSMQRFDTVFPAAGSSNSSVEMTCEELFRYGNALKWVDVCKEVI
ncbi:YbaK/EbsC family protein [Filifactor villosus]|uniref:YbaK/EbsC family protein n=1 Tax=Filifactor villosus TaxID=29374 RepID=A0ABV9QM02_9FIRM